MRSGAFLPVSLLTAALATTLAPRAFAEIVVNVDKNVQRMTVTVDGEQRYAWPVSTGRPGNDTPNGIFRPNRMDAAHLSQEWDNAPMPFAIFFDLHGRAFHGFLDINRIGNPASHGCVRLSPGNAAKLYDLLEMQGMKGTTIIISGSTPSPESIFAARRRALVEVTAVLPTQFVPHGGDQPQPYGKQVAAYVQEAPADQQQLAAFEKLQQPVPAKQPPVAPVASKQPPAISKQSPTASTQPATVTAQLPNRQAQPAYGQQRRNYVMQPSGGQRPAYGQPPYYYPTYLMLPPLYRIYTR